MARPDTDLFSGIVPFVHVARARSFRRAAEELGVSPAAVSKAVIALEERLGVKLLVRTSRAVSVTPEGEVILARGADAIAGLRAGIEHVSASLQRPRGVVRMTFSLILARSIVSALPQLARRNPLLEFRIEVTDRVLDLSAEGIDVAIRVGELAPSSLVVRRLRSSRRVTVAAPTYLARRGTPARPGDLAGHDCLRFLGPDGRPRDWAFSDAAGGSRVIPVRGSLMMNDGEHLLDAAVAGLGICQAFDFMVGDAVAAGRLVEVLAPYTAPGPLIHAVATPQRIRTPNVRAVVTFLAELFAGP